MLPCVIYEDEHLLVVNKPAGMNTHAPAPLASQGIFEWLRDREPRWAALAIVHRLDKETSGVMVFGKTNLANRSLTEQFAARSVRKHYVLLTDRAVPATKLSVKSSLVRAGERYLSRPLHAGADVAETEFRVQNSTNQARSGLPQGSYTWVEVTPLTGRTHQIRVHAASRGFPILGDALYGGTRAARLCLHSWKLVLEHPLTGKELNFEATPDFSTDSRLELRRAFVDPVETTVCRLIHGASDGWPGWYVDGLGDFLLSQSEGSLTAQQEAKMQESMDTNLLRGAYHKMLTRQVRNTKVQDVSPRHVKGEKAPERFIVRENGAEFELSFSEGYSVGLFLDQRDNRRRLMTRYVASDFPLYNAKEEGSVPQVLNVFAYTCGFSVCAALGGARVTSLDLSKKYLDWGRSNFMRNKLGLDARDFIYGDAFQWLRRLGRKDRTFDLVVLDPPTFSASKESGSFRVERDYGKLIAAALPLVRRGGVLFASANAANWASEEFLAVVRSAVTRSGRACQAQHFVAQPPDFPVSRAEPAYLKTVWMRVD